MLKKSRIEAIDIPIISGMLGLLLALFVLNFNGCKNEQSPYREIGIKNKRSLLDSLLRLRIQRIKKDLSQQSKLFVRLTGVGNSGPFANDSAKAVKSVVDSDIADLIAANKELNSIDAFNADTSLSYFAKYFSTDRDSLFWAIRTFNPVTQKDSVIRMPLKFYDKGALEDTAKVSLQLELWQVPRKKLLFFFMEYPSVGLWGVLSIIQMVFWFMVIPILLSQLSSLRSTAHLVTSTFDYWTFLRLCFLPLLFVGIYSCIFSIKLADGFVVSDYFFLSDYNTKALVYSVPGYIVIIFCLGAFLFLSKQLDTLDESTEDPTQKLAQFADLRKTFDAAFVCASLVLSILVLRLGVLFTAINGLEPMRYFSIVAGHPFLQYDLVYLMGMMHSVLLLIFYVPVRLKFNAMKIVSQASEAAPTNTSGKIFKSIFEAIPSVLVTASPLITGLLQSLLRNLFN